jgi:hypothetical protein
MSYRLAEGMAGNPGSYPRNLAVRVSWGLASIGPGSLDRTEALAAFERKPKLTLVYNGHRAFLCGPSDAGSMAKAKSRQSTRVFHRNVS